MAGCVKVSSGVGVCQGVVVVIGEHVVVVGGALGAPAGGSVCRWSRGGSCRGVVVDVGHECLCVFALQGGGQALEAIVVCGCVVLWVCLRMGELV